MRVTPPTPTPTLHPTLYTFPRKTRPYPGPMDSRCPLPPALHTLWQAPGLLWTKESHWRNEPKLMLDSLQRYCRQDRISQEKMHFNDMYEES